jgi:hypothetical protein
MSFIWWAAVGIVSLLGLLFLWALKREITQYLPTIGPWLVERSVRGLPEPTQTELREKWLGIAANVPGDFTRIGVGSRVRMVRAGLW